MVLFPTRENAYQVLQSDGFFRDGQIRNMT